MEQLIETTVKEPRRPVDSLVRVIGHIVEALRPDDFPQEIYIDHVVRDFTDEQIMNLINTTVTKIVATGAMVVMKDPGDEDQTGKVHFDLRMVVPVHMISHLTSDVMRMTEPVPGIEEQKQGLLQ